MAARLTGAVYVYRTHVLYVGALIASARHKHHASQVMWAPGGLDVVGEDGTARRVFTIVVPPDRYHGHGAAPAAAVLWVDPDDVDHLPWDRAQRRDEPARELPARLSGHLDTSLTSEDAGEIARALLELVAPDGDERTHVSQHPAVKRMRALLDATASEREVSVTQLARQSGLSMRQLRHRFTEEVGINPSAYLRWRRLLRAFAAIEGGATLTQAAFEAGFADASHFSRVFEAQFGMAPSQALSSVRFASVLR